MSDKKDPMNPSLPVPQEVREAMQQELIDQLNRLADSIDPPQLYVSAEHRTAAAACMRESARALLHAQRVAPISDERIEKMAIDNGFGFFGQWLLYQGDRNDLLRFARALLAEAVPPSPAPQAEAAVPVAIPDKARRLRDVLLTEDIYLSLDAAARVMLYVETIPATGMVDHKPGAQES